MAVIAIDVQVGWTSFVPGRLENYPAVFCVHGELPSTFMKGPSPRLRVVNLNFAVYDGEERNYGKRLEWRDVVERRFGNACANGIRD